MTNRIQNEKKNMFDTAHQLSMGDMDITYAPEGLTLSGHLRMPTGPKGAAIARKLADKLTKAADQMQDMEEEDIIDPETVPNPFGKAFDEE